MIRHARSANLKNVPKVKYILDCFSDLCLMYSVVFLGVFTTYKVGRPTLVVTSVKLIQSVVYKWKGICQYDKKKLACNLMISISCAYLMSQELSQDVCFDEGLYERTDCVYN